MSVDITGVRRPVYELIEAGLRRQRADAYLLGVSFARGDRHGQPSYAGDGTRLGKAYLAARLQTLQMRRLVLTALPEAEQVGRELLDYEIYVDANANDTYGAFRAGAHDDMVTALGLAVCCRRLGVGIWFL